MSAEPSTSLAATVADESDEVMAEAQATSTTTAKTEPTEAEGGGEIKAEEKPDPNAIPEDACVTLYLQNLNEKVRIPGTSMSNFDGVMWRRAADTSFSDEANPFELV
jgi:hypothetical protein